MAETYDFEMASKQTHALVKHNGLVIGTIQHDFTGAVNFAQDETHSRHIDEVGDEMWDQFDKWWDTQELSK